MSTVRIPAPTEADATYTFQQMHPRDAINYVSQTEPFVWEVGTLNPVVYDSEGNAEQVLLVKRYDDDFSYSGEASRVTTSLTVLRGVGDILEDKIVRGAASAFEQACGEQGVSPLTIQVTKRVGIIHETYYITTEMHGSLVAVSIALIIIGALLVLLSLFTGGLALVVGASLLATGEGGFLVEVFVRGAEAFNHNILNPTVEQDIWVMPDGTQVAPGTPGAKKLTVRKPGQSLSGVFMIAALGGAALVGLYIFKEVSKTRQSRRSAT